MKPNIESRGFKIEVYDAGVWAWFETARDIHHLLALLGFLGASRADRLISVNGERMTCAGAIARFKDEATSNLDADRRSASTYIGRHI